jgi:SPP1 family predicted phage head-tail adaptor
MRANELRHQISLQMRGTATDALGQQDPTWTTFAQPWAKVEELSGSELMASKAEHAKNIVRLTIRYRYGLTEQMRVLYGCKILNITSISDLDGRRRELEVMCETGMNQG